MGSNQRAPKNSAGTFPPYRKDPRAVSTIAHSDQPADVLDNALAAPPGGIDAGGVPGQASAIRVGLDSDRGNFRFLHRRPVHLYTVPPLHLADSILDRKE